MKKFTSCTALTVLSFLILFVTSVTAQTQTPRVEQSYEMALYVVVGSNDASGKGDLPASLSGVSRHLRNNFAFSNYRLANTFLGRISNTGSITYRSVSNVFGQEEPGAQTFLEWSVGAFRSLPNGFEMGGFNFGTKVPVRVEDTKTSFEFVGITTGLIGVQADTPTLIGTLSLPKTSGTIFIIANIRQAGV